MKDLYAKFISYLGDHKGLLYFLTGIAVASAIFLFFILRSCDRQTPVTNNSIIDTVLSNYYKNKIKGYELLCGHKDTNIKILKDANAVLVAQIVKHQIPKHYTNNNTSFKTSDSLLVAFRDSCNTLYQFRQVCWIQGQEIAEMDSDIIGKDSIIDNYYKISKKQANDILILSNDRLETMKAISELKAELTGKKKMNKYLWWTNAGQLVLHILRFL